LIAATIERRQELMRRAPEAAPRDLLTLLLEAEGLGRAEVEDNIITFIGAGTRPRRGRLGWALYLLSQRRRSLPRSRPRSTRMISAIPIRAAGSTSWS